MRTAFLATLGAIAAVTVAAPSLAQNPQPSQEQLIELRTKKLAKPVFQLAKWETDYDAARAAAKKDGKLLFVYFTRSYAT